jgi:hypothetical protein
MRIRKVSKKALKATLYAFSLVVLAGQTVSFRPADTLLILPHAAAAASADFDGDGITDIVVVHPADSSVSILVGDGLGRFASRPRLITGARPNAVVTGDWNNDRKADLAISCQGDGTTSASIALFTGNGNGTFTPADYLDANAGPTALATADLNGDGRTDLIVSYGSNANPAYGVWLGRAEGRFEAVLPAAPGPARHAATTPQSLVAGDVNGDGKLDLVISPRTEPLVLPPNPQPGQHGVFPAGTPDRVAILLGNGDGTFLEPQRIKLGESLVAMAGADFDGDGAMDVAIADDRYSEFLTGELHLLRGGDAGLGVARAPVLGFNYPSTVAACDVNGDARPDIVIPQFGFEFRICGAGFCFDPGLPPQPSSLAIYLSEGQEEFRLVKEPRFHAPLDANPKFLQCTDVNRDGRADLIFLNGGYLSIWLNESR